MRIRLILSLAVAVQLIAQLVAAADSGNLDWKALTDAAARTARRLRSEPAYWAILCTLQNGATAEIDITNAGSKRRTIITAGRGAQTFELFRVVSRDGLWYVTDRNGSGKYRPYEVPANLPFIYKALELSEPRLITSADQLAGCQIDRVVGNIATVHMPLGEAEAAQLRSALEQLDMVAARSPLGLPEETEKQRSDMKDLLAHGRTIRIDTATGQMVEFATPQLHLEVADFKFLPHEPADEFAVDGKNWRDFSDDPTKGKLENLIMIQHQPLATIDRKGGDTDGRLMDVETGRFRRIPFPGGGVVPGCFLKGRRSVVVEGTDSEHGNLRPFRIDLSTGKCEPLGGPILDSGFTLGGDVSPDGKTVAVTHLDLTKGLMKSQICLIDLQSGRARPIGKPLDTSFAYWTADGKKLVLLSRKIHGDLDQPTDDYVATMDMDGNLTELCPGSMLVLLADRRTILFEDKATDLWQTCDLNGQNVKPYAGGLKGFGFPAPAPDGKRILMMHFVEGELPKPMLLPIGSSEGQAITNVGGLWAMPRW